MDAGDLLPRHGEQAVRIMVAQVALVQEREAHEIGQILDVVRMRARLVEDLAVMLDVAIRVADRPFQALELQPRDLIAARRLDRIEADLHTLTHLYIRSTGGIRNSMDADHRQHLV